MAWMLGIVQHQQSQDQALVKGPWYVPVMHVLFARENNITFSSIYMRGTWNQMSCCIVWVLNLMDRWCAHLCQVACYVVENVPRTGVEHTTDGQEALRPVWDR